MICLNSEETGSDLRNINPLSVPNLTWEITTEKIVVYDWVVELRKTNETTLELINLTFPSNFSHHIITEATITLFIQDEGQWYELSQYHYTKEGLVITNLELNRSYLFQITLDDNSNGQSLIIRPIVKLNNRTSKYSLFTFVLALLFWNLIKRRKKVS